MDNPNIGRPVHNRYKVPVAEWREWTNFQRSVFNRTFAALKYQPDFVPAPWDLMYDHRWNEMRRLIAMRLTVALKEVKRNVNKRKLDHMRRNKNTRTKRR